MSYLTLPRLTFSGWWQADVSTVNNDVRHYDNSTFEPRFQLPQGPNAQNGWWNPEGTGAFRFIDVKIQQALTKPGDDPTTDPATSLSLVAQESRSSAKMVDLDPQMQVVSTIFGLKIVLTDGEHVYLSADHKPTPFRDLNNGRVGPASATFSSVLTNLVWGEQAQHSPTLVALKAAAEQNDGKLFLHYMTYAFAGLDLGGLLTGAIGTYEAGAPEELVAARRLNHHPQKSAPPNETLGDLIADVDSAQASLSLDLSIAVPLAVGSGPHDISVMYMGEIYTAILLESDVVSDIGTPSGQVKVGVKQGDVLGSDKLKLLSPIDYSAKDWLQKTAGIVDNPLDSEARDLLAANLQSDGLYTSHPIAIVKKVGSSYQVLIRETHGGFYARADQFVFRIDPPLSGKTDVDAEVVVRQWGQPVSKAPVVFALESTKVSGNYWGPGPPEPHPPKAPYPKINTPAQAVSIPGAVLPNADGVARAVLGLSDPGNPRTYVDGQIYTIRYQLAIKNASPQAPFDLLVIHARTANKYPDLPDWDTDIKPFMQQYDNLYPVMSKHLFSLSDASVFQQHAKLLSFAFSAPESDPGHMPVTRDLSLSKRYAVLNWLAQYTKQAPPKIAQPPTSGAKEASTVVTQKDAANLPQPDDYSLVRFKAMLAVVEDGSGGKNPVARSYLSAEIARMESED